jgi:hypothetical protein
VNRKTIAFARSLFLSVCCWIGVSVAVAEEPLPIALEKGYLGSPKIVRTETYEISEDEIPQLVSREIERFDEEGWLESRVNTSYLAGGALDSRAVVLVDNSAVDENSAVIYTLSMYLHDGHYSSVVTAYSIGDTGVTRKVSYGRWSGKTERSFYEYSGERLISRKSESRTGFSGLRWDSREIFLYDSNARLDEVINVEEVMGAEIRTTSKYHYDKDGFNDKIITYSADGSILTTAYIISNRGRHYFYEYSGETRHMSFNTISGNIVSVSHDAPDIRHIPPAGDYELKQIGDTEDDYSAELVIDDDGTVFSGTFLEIDNGRVMVEYYFEFDTSDEEDFIAITDEKNRVVKEVEYGSDGGHVHVTAYTYQGDDFTKETERFSRDWRADNSSRRFTHEVTSIQRRYGDQKAYSYSEERIDSDGQVEVRTFFDEFSRIVAVTHYEYVLPEMLVYERAESTSAEASFVVVRDPFTEIAERYESPMFHKDRSDTSVGVVVEDEGIMSDLILFPLDFLRRDFKTKTRRASFSLPDGQPLAEVERVWADGEERLVQRFLFDDTAYEISHDMVEHNELRILETSEGEVWEARLPFVGENERFIWLGGEDFDYFDTICIMKGVGTEPTRQDVTHTIIENQQHEWTLDDEGNIVFDEIFASTGEAEREDRSLETRILREIVYH